LLLVPFTLQVPTDEWRQCLQAERAETHILHHEADPERMGTVVDMVGEAVADLEAHEADMVVVAVDPWALLLHPGTGDVVRDLVLTAAAVEVASEAEEVATSGLLFDLDVSTDYVTDLQKKRLLVAF
jgi:hypothetical protein